MNPQKRILVVEDEKPIAKALELKLTHSGFDVTVAGDGENALEISLHRNFDLILLDLIMPKMDGFEVLTKLKERHSNIPIIVTSNLGQKEDMEKVKELGAIEYFVKSNTPIATIVNYIKNKLEA